MANLAKFLQSPDFGYHESDEFNHGGEYAENGIRDEILPGYHRATNLLKTVNFVNFAFIVEFFGALVPLL